MKKLLFLLIPILPYCIFIIISCPRKRGRAIRSYSSLQRFFPRLLWGNRYYPSLPVPAERSLPTPHPVGCVHLFTETKKIYLNRNYLSKNTEPATFPRIVIYGIRIFHWYITIAPTHLYFFSQVFIQ